MHHQTFANEIRLYYVGTWYIVQHCYISRPIRFCSKICHVGGRLIAAPTQMYHIVHGAYFQAVNIFEFVGTDIIRPVVSPRGNNVGAKRRQWHHRTFANEFWRYYVETWYIAARCAARFPRGIAGRILSAPTLVRATLAGGCHQLTLCAARAASTTHLLFSLLLSIKDKVLLK